MLHLFLRKGIDLPASCPVSIQVRNLSSPSKTNPTRPQARPRRTSGGGGSHPSMQPFAAPAALLAPAAHGSRALSRKGEFLSQLECCSAWIYFRLLENKVDL